MKASLGELYRPGSVEATKRVQLTSSKILLTFRKEHRLGSSEELTFSVRAAVDWIRDYEYVVHFPVEPLGIMRSNPPGERQP